MIKIILFLSLTILFPSNTYINYHSGNYKLIISFINHKSKECILLPKYIKVHPKSTFQS